MNTDKATSLALRCFLFIGIALAAAGLMLSGYDQGDEIMWAGLLILIASPFAGVIVTASGLTAEKDWKWIKVAAVLITVIVVFLIASLFGFLP